MHHEARRKRTRGREDKEDIDKEEEDKVEGRTWRT